MTVEDKQVLHDAALILRTLADEGKVVAFGPARGAAGILAQRLDDMRKRQPAPPDLRPDPVDIEPLI